LLLLLLCHAFAAQRAPGQLAGYVVLREKTASRNKENSHYSDPLRPGIQEAQVIMLNLSNPSCLMLFYLIVIPHCYV
jgi:hypothetical protein